MILTHTPISYILSKNDALIRIVNSLDINTLRDITKHTTLDITGEMLVRLTEGWNHSNKLINTPNNPLGLLLLVDKCIINAYLQNCTYNNKTNICTYKLKDKEFSVETTNLNIELQTLGYYYRLGYSVTEVPLKGYVVREPYGSKYFVDLKTCNCREFLEKSDCIHLKLSRYTHNNRLNHV